MVSAEEARARFTRRIDLSPLSSEMVKLPAALGRVLAHDVTAPIDVPPFDRANVDGFALRSADSVGASDIAPRRLRLNGEVIVCGHAPALEVAPGSATTTPLRSASVLSPSRLEPLAASPFTLSA